MRILIAHVYPQRLLSSIYKAESGLNMKPYSDQLSAVSKGSFGIQDPYVLNLTALGHEAQSVFVNCLPLQRTWATENSVRMLAHRRLRWENDILREQVRAFHPEVLILDHINYFRPEFVDSLKREVDLIVGESAYELDWTYPFEVYDVIFSSLPNYVDAFRSRMINSELLHFGFESSLIDEFGETQRDIELSFIGGIAPTHALSISNLEKIAEEFPLRVWGYGAELLPPDSILRGIHGGEVWGGDMYRVLGRSKITINRHSRVAGDYVNNVRMFEATGMGACLLNNEGVNLRDLFRVPDEVVAYNNLADLKKKIAWLLSQPDDRERVGIAGQSRTLDDYSYKQRVIRMVKYIELYQLKSRATPISWARPPLRSRMRQFARELIRGSPWSDRIRQAMERRRLRRVAPQRSDRL